MRFLLALALAGALGLSAVSAFAYDGGWYAKWRGQAPLTVCVQNVASLPADQQVQFRAAMAAWSVSASVDLVEGSGCDGKFSVRVGDKCQLACFDPRFANYTLHGGVLWVNPVIFAWGDNTWVYCHEQGHGLGLSEGYGGPNPDPASCMAGTAATPSESDMVRLSEMYP